MGSNKSKIVFIFYLFLILYNGNIFSQIVPVHLDNSVYDFLERMRIKKYIKLDDEVMPFSRIYIANKLSELKLKIDKLNTVEIKELEFYLEEYAYEVKKERKSIRLYGFIEDSLYQIKVYPILGYGIKKTGDKSGFIKWPGLGVFGTYSNYFGAYFSYRDFGEFGDNVDKKKDLTSLTGASYKDVPNGIEYSDVLGGISWNNDWITLSLVKDYWVFGHSKNGNLILSNKAPSFPHLRFIIKPTEWLRFYYTHGWLTSNVLDSVNFYYSHPESKRPQLIETFIDKFFVANLLTISPYDWLDFSLGNSFIYSGSMRAEMFIPFMYYKVMDHNTGKGAVNDGNGMIYFDVAVNYPKNYIFYSTLLIDVLEIREILKGNWWTSWFGYTLGTKNVDLFIPNLGLTIEYTRLNPWIYENRNNTNSYKHIDFTLGHWIGQNADNFLVRFDYKFIRSLNISLQYEAFRKGGLKDIYYAYDERTNLPFLYSPIRISKEFTIKMTYEPFHEMFVRGYFKFSDVTDEDKMRTPEYMLGKKTSFGLSFSYGL